MEIDRAIPVLPVCGATGFKRGYGALNSTNGRNGKPTSAHGVHSYVMPAFGDRLGEVRLAPVA
jgi:hypothetical protein